jgi:hypothetical protein
MPEFPWVERQEVDVDRRYVAMASRLPLNRHRSIPGFLRDTLTIRHQLASASCLVGYALDANLLQKTFWTFSVWNDRSTLDAFAQSGPHHRIIERLRPLMAARFEFFDINGSELPMTWPQMKAPLDT